MNRQLISWETLKVPLSNGGLVNQEGSKRKLLTDWHVSSHNVIVEVLFNELVSEFRVEWSAIRHKSACLGNISNKSEFKTLVLVGVLDPSFFVVLEGVNKSVGLVHLSSGLHGLVLEGLLSRHLVVELLSKGFLDSVTLVQLFLGVLQVSLGFLELSGFDFKLLKLWLHNLGLLMVVTHSSSPNTHTLKGTRGGFSDVWGESLVSISLLELKIWL